MDNLSTQNFMCIPHWWTYGCRFNMKLDNIPWCFGISLQLLTIRIINYTNKIKLNKQYTHLLLEMTI